MTNIIYRYARPLAEGLRTNKRFRIWFLGKTKYASFGDSAVVLAKEQREKRTPSAANWWEDYWTDDARSKGECGQTRTYLLAVFEAEGGFRFALHVEVKAPNGKFLEKQATNYGRRARCWAGKGRNPDTVLEHDEATTVLCCGEEFREKYKADASQFDSVVTFEEIAGQLDDFPDAV